MVALTPAWTGESSNPSQTGNYGSTDAAGDSDTTLLTACRRGDGDAWDALVDRYDRLVFAVALRNGLEREDAADVTQEVFVALLDSLDAIKDDTALASWLMTVARRKAWRLRNRNGLLRRPTDACSGDANDPVEDWTSLTTLHTAVSQLGEPCRTLIQQLYLDADEPSYAEIAVRMGRSIGGIGPLRGRCLGRLRSMIGEDFR